MSTPDGKVAIIIGGSSDIDAGRPAGAVRDSLARVRAALQATRPANRSAAAE